MSRFSFVSLIFAAISLLCFGALRLVFSGWVIYMWVPIGLFVVFTAAALIRDFSTIREFFTMKTTKNGMNMGAMIILVLGILVAINFLSVRRTKTFDLTDNKMNSLSDMSNKVLAKLEDEISFKFFYAEGESGLEQERAAFRELIRKYEDASTKVKLEYVEMNERPDLAEEYGVRQGGGIVFVEYQGRKNRIDRIEEQEITAAIIKVSKENKRVVYFVEGHGEADLFDSSSVRGLATFRGFLEGNQYDVKSLSLLDAEKVPQDASLVAVIGPTQTLLDVEVIALKEYAARGGSLFLAVDPEISHGMDELFTALGTQVENNYIGFVLFGRRVQPTVANFYSQTHQATKIFKEKTATAFRFASSLKKIEGPEFKFEEIVKTPASSFAFEGPTAMKPIGKGPHTMVASITGKLAFTPPQGFKTDGFKYGESEFKAVIAGDTDFMRNQLIAAQFNNSDLIQNIFAYLSGEEDMISIRPPQLERTEMTMTETKMMAYTFGFIVPLPLILLGISIFLGIRRRHA